MLYRMTNREPWEPWSRLRRLEREIGRLFGESDRPGAASFPLVNIWTSADGAVVTAEVPGVDPGSLDITAVGSALTIRGDRQTNAPKEDHVWHRHERKEGSFARTIELPFAVDPDSVDAACRDGVLEVRLTRPQEQKPRKIAVKTS